ncbi:unnamed protein product [Closterium sp. Yama58-4]|nr:unnamed protein product [Closterium sp. Yama58-4]
MAKNKSPGSDGLPKERFEAHWDLLGGSFMAMARDFESTASLPAEIKEAVTIVLHKKGVRDQLNNYRPITLLNFTYKYGFLPGRRLSDAVALVADIIDAAKNENEDWYLLLVDFQKAFDSVSRDFLFQVLRGMGFPPRFVKWIGGLHENTAAKLLVNGWLGEGLEVVSGVRQGCPLATYLFLCAVEPLAQEVGRAKLGLSKDEQRLNYLGYAATRPYFKWAGANDAEKLLGVWVSPSGSGVKTWKKALCHITEKLIKWKQKYLTTSARATVITYYIVPIVAFQAQIYPPPADTWDDVTRLIHGFVSEKNLVKRDIMTKAADLPLGVDSFASHEKLMKHWDGQSIRWRQTCECFIHFPLCIWPAAVTREDVLQERVVFNTRILLNETTPIGGQKDVKQLRELRLGDLLEEEADGGLVSLSMAELSQRLGGSGPARLASKALGAIPALWLRRCSPARLA